jgi:hypothetical protein
VRAEQYQNAPRYVQCCFTLIEMKPKRRPVFIPQTVSRLRLNTLNKHIYVRMVCACFVIDAFSSDTRNAHPRARTAANRSAVRLPPPPAVAPPPPRHNRF